jgi:hypothetical protein
MIQDDQVRPAVHRALEPMVRPAPDLSSRVLEHVRDVRRVRGKTGLRRLARNMGVLVAAAVIAFVGVVIRPGSSTHEGPVPPGPGGTFAPISIGPGASIAWLDNLTGFDAQGHVVGRIESQTAIRSGYGDIYVLAPQKIEVYDATDGRLQRTISRPGSGDAAALTPDGRYMAVLDEAPPDGTPPAVEMINLKTGAVASKTLGSTFATSDLAFSLTSQDSSRIVAVSNFWKTPTVAVLRFDGSTLTLEHQATDGQSRHRLASCDGMSPDNPASIPVRLLADGNTMVSVCPGNGVVSWVDLNRLTVVATLQVPIANPFWMSSVFSADGSMLYAYEGGTGRITSIDLTRRAIIRTAVVNAPTAFDPFGWLADRLFPPVYAGGLSRSAALSPDGTVLYVTGAFDRPVGVAAIDLRDFHVNAQWKVDAGGSLWLSGDGQTLYATRNAGDQLTILHLGDGSVVTVPLTPSGSDFLPLAN